MKFNLKKNSKMSKQECTEALNMRNQHLFEKSNAKLVFAVKQTKNTFKQHQNRIETEKRTKLTLKTIGNSLANLFKPTVMQILLKFYLQ